MFKPVQVSSRIQLSEQTFSDDDDDVSFAVSKAHLTGPFCVILDFLKETTLTELSPADVIGTNTPSSNSSSSSSVGNIDASIVFISVFVSCS